MTDWIEKAKAQRAIFNRQGSFLTDSEAATVVTAYPEWGVGIEITQNMIDSGLNRYRVSKQLYKTTVAHTTIPSWAPELAPTVWIPINIDHAGTVDDPIPAAVGLTYIEGLHYIENDDAIYLCNRQDTPNGTVLYYLPSQLVGVYFERIR